MPGIGLSADERNDLADAVDPLSYEQRAAFAAAVAERTLRVYWASFDEPSGAPRAGVEFVWRMAGGADAQVSEVRRILRELVAATPDLDDAGSVFTAALAAVVAVASAVEAVTDPFPTSAVTAAVQALEAAADYVDLDSESEADVDRANDNEAEWQRNLVTALAQENDPQNLRRVAQAASAAHPPVWFPYPEPEY